MNDSAKEGWIIIIGFIVGIASMLMIGVYLFNTMHYHSQNHIVDATPWLSIILAPLSVVLSLWLAAKYL